MERRPRGARGSAPTFLAAGWRYWTHVWPIARSEIFAWRRCAERIPDSALRTAALRNLDEEHGNLEGAAAFAVIASRRHRRQLVRALVAFQAIYDYVDTLVEEHHHGDRGSRRLHAALADALDAASRTRFEYYAHRPADDGGYLADLVAACRAAVAALPAHATVGPSATTATVLMIEYQARNHASTTSPATALARWAPGALPSTSGYQWWEAAASAASSLVVFALLALATDERTTAADAERVVEAYASAGALHVLLDSYADRADDALAGDHSLIAHYPDNATATRRLCSLARTARDRTLALRNGDTHRLILCAMTSFYLVAANRGTATRLTTRHLLVALGRPARATTAILRARTSLACLIARARRQASAI